jgi:hypothetical protein
VKAKSSGELVKVRDEINGEHNIQLHDIEYRAVGLCSWSTVSELLGNSEVLLSVNKA